VLRWSRLAAAAGSLELNQNLAVDLIAVVSNEVLNSLTDFGVLDEVVVEVGRNWLATVGIDGESVRRDVDEDVIPFMSMVRLRLSRLEHHVPDSNSVVFEEQLRADVRPGFVS
jgi:hypothetical protein